ncbi:MAG: hypothetical protein HOV81_08655 [Kofleriaceae bacterium]|nr:hypothetical protein [Kofleriaceae bacterium]
MLSAVVLGLAQGIQHSFEPDHLAALSTLVGDRRGAWRCAQLGAIWGVGHTSTLCLVGACVLAVDAGLPDSADHVFKLAVGVFLVALGIRSMLPPRRPQASRAIRTPVQAMLVGMLHGLAGSSGLIALAVAALPTFAARIVYIAVFGLGSIGGMAGVSALAGIGFGAVRDDVFALVRVPLGIVTAAIGVQSIATGWAGL